MVRQYKIHTNLDGADDKVWDVTNGKVRFYQPSNLGLQSTNNIWQSNGIGVMGTRSITQPQIEFKLETFGESLEENYQLMKDFVNDILSQKFVTLEYQTEIFQVYADLALADVTKTEGYGKNGTFSEKITFDIITKWYTYENLTFDMIKNGKVIAGKSKIYGGYKGDETPLQNYNRLKASPSLNLPNLNLLDGTKDFSGSWENASGWITDGTYKDLTVKKRTAKWGGIYKTFTAPENGVYVFSAYVKSLGENANITRFVSTSAGYVVPDKELGNNFDWTLDIFAVVLKAKDTISARYEITGSGSESALWTAGHKWGEVMPIADDFTTVYPNFNLLKNTKNLTATSTSSAWNILFSSDQIYDPVIKSKTGVSAMTFSFNVFVPSNAVVGSAISIQLKGQTYQAHGNVGTDDYNTFLCRYWHNIEQSDLGKTIRVSIPAELDSKYHSFGSALAVSDSITIRQVSGTAGLVYSKLKLETGSIATPWLPSERESQNQRTSYMPSATELTTADISEYFGYNYVANQAYTYYGESNIERLSRWDIKDEIFSFMGILYPKLPKTPAGVRFLDDNGNEYTAIVFKVEQVQNYILINTDVNDEIYQGWNGTTSLNLFPVMDFERYRTRIIEHGQMELINLSKAEFKIKRKADFV